MSSLALSNSLQQYPRYSPPFSLEGKMEPVERQLRHLEMIQAVITRMASNSFLLKGWSVLIVSAFFALAASNADVRFALLALFPAIAFWILDGYFLRQERLFRKLFDSVRKRQPAECDFSLNTSPFDAEVASWADVSFSKTLFLFHGPVCGAILVVIAILVFTH